MSDKVFLGTRMAQLDISPALAPVSKVILAVDSENAYIAGDDTGRTIEVTCPYGTQEMANNILAALSSYTYTPAMAQDAILDPAAEIGDGLTMGGVYTVLAQSTLTFDGLMTSDAGAPGQAEQESEYKYQSPVIADINWQLAQTRSLISKTSEEILLQVENELEGLSSSFSVQLDNITGRVNGLDGEFAELSLTLDGLTVTDGSGTTKIKGDRVETENLYVNAANISGTLTANQINLTGAITWGDLASDAQNQVTNAQNLASSAYGTAVSAQTSANTANSQISAWTYPGSTMINGNMLKTGTVMATQLLGGYVGLLNQYQQAVGNMTIGVATTGYAVELNSSGGLRLSSSGNFWVDSSYGTLGITASGVISGGNCVPGAGSRYSLGAPGLNWTQVYADNSTIVTSDRNKKTDITYDMSQYSALFDLLKPTPYKLAGGTSGRVHLGLISQDVEKELSEAGLSSLKFAGFIKSTTEDGDLYALRYEEFIPLLIYEVQSLKKRVAELEALWKKQKRKSRKH